LAEDQNEPDPGSGLPLEHGSRKRSSKFRRGHLGRGHRSDPSGLQGERNQGVYDQLDFFKPDHNDRQTDRAWLQLGWNY